MTPARPGSYRDELFDELAGREDLSFWFRSRNRLIEWSLRKYFPGAQSLLDIGCGTGYVLAHVRTRLPGLRLVGVDASAAGLAVAAKRSPDVELYEADILALPNKNEFDVVTILDVLEHLDDDETALERAARAVRPGGGMLVTVPQHPWLWSTADEHAGHARRYSRRDIVRKMRRARLEPVRITSFTAILLPPLALKRALARVRPDAYSLAAELEAPRLLDRTFEAIMTVERALIRAGVSFRAGGSLLVAARRA